MLCIAIKKKHIHYESSDVMVWLTFVLHCTVPWYITQFQVACCSASRSSKKTAFLITNYTIFTIHTSWSRPLFFQLLILLDPTSSWFISFDISLAKTQRKYRNHTESTTSKMPARQMTSHFPRSPNIDITDILIGSQSRSVLSQKYCIIFKMCNFLYIIQPRKDFEIMFQYFFSLSLWNRSFMVL